MRVHEYGLKVAIMYKADAMCIVQPSAHTSEPTLYALKHVVMATVCSKCFSVVSRNGC